MSSSSIRVGVYSESLGSKYWELLTDENIKMFDKSRQDIASVEYRQYYPAYPYTEAGVAWKGHPLVGSGSAIVHFNDGTKATISDVFYQDPNLMQNHSEGLPHWNKERRFMYDRWPSPRTYMSIEYHNIPKSPYIDIVAQGVGVAGFPAKPVRVIWNDNVEVDGKLISLD